MQIPLNELFYLTKSDIKRHFIQSQEFERHSYLLSCYGRLFLQNNTFATDFSCKFSRYHFLKVLNKTNRISLWI